MTNKITKAIEERRKEFDVKLNVIYSKALENKSRYGLVKVTDLLFKEFANLESHNKQTTISLLNAIREEIGGIKGFEIDRRTFLNQIPRKKVDTILEETIKEIT